MTVRKKREVCHSDILFIETSPKAMWHLWHSHNFLPIKFTAAVR